MEVSKASGDFSGSHISRPSPPVSSAHTAAKWVINQRMLGSYWQDFICTHLLTPKNLPAATIMVSAALLPCKISYKNLSWVAPNPEQPTGTDLRKFDYQGLGESIARSREVVLSLHQTIWYRFF